MAAPRRPCQRGISGDVDREFLAQRDARPPRHLADERHVGPGQVVYVQDRDESLRAQVERLVDRMPDPGSGLRDATKRSTIFVAPSAAHPQQILPRLRWRFDLPAGATQRAERARCWPSSSSTVAMSMKNEHRYGPATTPTTALPSIDGDLVLRNSVAKSADS